MAGALALLGTKHALLVSSEDGLDELSISAPTRVVEVLGGALRRYAVAPEDVGLRRAPAEQVPGGDPVQNAQTAREILAGEAGAARDLAVLNAAAAIYAGGAADSLEAGVRAAEDAITSGAGAEALARFVRRTNELAPSRQ
jgi:anthranilate phosphoribosyltransferase